MLQNYKVSKRGFTLIELLIVIGILAILAATTVLVLNPVRFFQEARDSQRIGDLDAVKSAMYLRLSDTTAVLPAAGFTCNAVAPALANFGSSLAGTVTDFVAGQRTTIKNAGAVGIDGTGWVALDFGANSGLSRLPLDPTNSVKYNYQFACDTVGSLFELNAKLESAKYGGCSATSLDFKDGGDKNTNPSVTDTDCLYEVGSSLTL